MSIGTMVSITCLEGILANDANDFIVGGEILDLALGQAKLFGRIVKCGSEYLQRETPLLVH